MNREEAAKIQRHALDASAAINRIEEIVLALT